MPTATQSFHNRIALVFDFDATLAPSSTDTLLKSCGLEPERFKKERVHPLTDAGWDALLAKGYAIIDALRERGDALTKDELQAVGRTIEPFDGVPEMFERVRQCAGEIVSDLEVEFYVLTSGWAQMHRATSIADEFDTIWGSEFYFDDRGEADFVKQIVTHAEKVRYVLQLSKGLGTRGPNAPEDVYRDVPEEDLHVPLDQVLYLGDGASDLPVFSLMGDRGGMALGIFKQSPDQWSSRSKMHTGRRVQNLAQADYREDSELMQSITLAVESMCKHVALERLSVGE